MSASPLVLNTWKLSYSLPSVSGWTRPWQINQYRRTFASLTTLRKCHQHFRVEYPVQLFAFQALHGKPVRAPSFSVGSSGSFIFPVRTPRFPRIVARKSCSWIHHSLGCISGWSKGSRLFFSDCWSPLLSYWMAPRSLLLVYRDVVGIDSSSLSINWGSRTCRDLVTWALLFHSSGSPFFLCGTWPWVRLCLCSLMGLEWADVIVFITSRTLLSIHRKCLLKPSTYYNAWTFHNHKSTDVLLWVLGIPLIITPLSRTNWWKLCFLDHEELPMMSYSDICIPWSTNLKFRFVMILALLCRWSAATSFALNGCRSLGSKILSVHPNMSLRLLFPISKPLY